MRVGGSQIQTLVNNTLQNRDVQRQQAQQTAREQEKTNAREQPSAVFEQDVQISDAARRASRNQQVPASDKSASPQRGPQYYPFPDRSGLSASQQKAVQTYASNQDLSRTDGKGEFLGSLDVFA